MNVHVFSSHIKPTETGAYAGVCSKNMDISKGSLWGVCRDFPGVLQGWVGILYRFERTIQQSLTDCEGRVDAGKSF